MSEPTTDSGRALLDAIEFPPFKYGAADLNAYIIAIEQEAAADARDNEDAVRLNALDLIADLERLQAENTALRAVVTAARAFCTDWAGDPDFGPATDDLVDALTALDAALAATPDTTTKETVDE